MHTYVTITHNAVNKKLHIKGFLSVHYVTDIHQNWHEKLPQHLSIWLAPIGQSVVLSI